MEVREFNINGFKVLVDQCDAHLLDNINKKRVVDGWSGIKYVMIYIGGKHRPLHRLVAGTPDGMETDHINGDGLYNRRCNLRIVTHRQNALNSFKKKSAKSRFKGVYYVARIDCWRARIRLDNGERMHLGYFKDEVAAAHAYDLASLEHHGEFGRRNFLPLS